MDAVKQGDNYILVDINVSTSSDHFTLAGYNPWRITLEVKIKSPPLKGKANKEIIKEFSKLTGCPVEILSGLKSHQKTLKITGISKKRFLDMIAGLSNYNYHME